MFDQCNPLFQKARLFLLQPLQNDLEYLDFCKFPASMHQDLCISHKLSKNVDHFCAASSQIRLSNGNTHNNFRWPLPSIRKIQDSLSLPRKRCHANVITAYFLVDFHLIEMIYHHIFTYPLKPNLCIPVFTSFTNLPLTFLFVQYSKCTWVQLVRITWYGNKHEFDIYIFASSSVIIISLLEQLLGAIYVPEILILSTFNFDNRVVIFIFNYCNSTVIAPY